jgi:hypothetical protein
MKNSRTANLTVVTMGTEEVDKPNINADNTSEVRSFSDKAVQKETSVHRLTLELSSRSLAQLEELSQITGQTKKAEVIRDALRLYYRLANEAADGAEVSIRRKNGSVFHVFVD